MDFSNRDRLNVSPFKTLSSQSGQGVIEYLLVLVVIVGMILGATYQLNSAFKSWANNYFGEYLACLLETGELPTIGGNPGDSGICNEIFRPFSLAEGRPLGDQFGKGGGSSGGNAGGMREERRIGGNGAGSANPLRLGGRGFGSGGRGSNAGGKGRRGDGSGAYTGSTDVSSYGAGYSSRLTRIPNSDEKRLDQKFAFDDEKERVRGRKAGASAKSGEGGQQIGRTPLPKPKPKNEEGPDAEAGMGFSDFIRFLIIAAIVVALVLFLGGQALQIGKSMER